MDEPNVLVREVCLNLKLRTVRYDPHELFPNGRDLPNGCDG